MEMNMGEKIYFYTDGSYRDNICGYSFQFFSERKPINRTFILGKCEVGDSQSAELIAVIRTFEFIKEYFIKENILSTFCIYTDALDIYEFINKQIFKEWDANSWKKKNGMPIRSINLINLYYKLSCLYKSLPVGIIEIGRVRSRGKHNRLVDNFARLVLNSSQYQKGNNYIVKDYTKQKYNTREFTAELIEFKTFNFDKNERPWDNSKM